MYNKYNFYFIFIILVFLPCTLSACGNSLNLVKGPEDFKRYTEWEQKQREAANLDQYIGMSKEDIVAKFGKPTYRDYDVSYKVAFDDVNKKWIKEKADERYIYRFSRGVPLIHENIESIIFYFRNNRVVKAELP